MGTGTGSEAENRKEEEDDDKQDDFESQISLNSSTQENDAYTNRETGSMDRFGVVRTISKTTNGSNQTGDFVTMTNSEVQLGKNRNAGPGNPPADPEADYEETSYCLRQRSKTRVSTSTKLPGTDRVTPLLVTPLVDNEASIEEGLTNIVNSKGEQNEKMSLRMSELERAVHAERESLREEMNCNRQADKKSAEMKNARRRQTRADRRDDAMMERRTQAIMDRLDGLIGNRSGSRLGKQTQEKPPGSRE